jgi:hypothetical protein
MEPMGLWSFIIPSKPAINWNKPDCKISKYFTVHDATYLHSWGCSHIPSETEKANILVVAKIMDQIRDKLGAPISVDCWIRPTLNCPGNPHNGQDYNIFIKGAPNSAHKTGQAVDWTCAGKTCDQVRTILVPMLVTLGIRMENLPGSGWIHIDNRAPVGPRFFKP